MELASITKEKNSIHGIITATKHFDFVQSLEFLDSSGANDRLDMIDTDEAILKRPMLIDDIPYMVMLEAVEQLKLKVTIQAQDDDELPDEAALQYAADWAGHRFWLFVDMDAVCDALAVDDYGKLIVDTSFPMRPANYPSAWEALLISVNHAQVFPGLAKTLDNNLAEVFGMKGIFEGETYYLTPRPFDLLRANPDELRGMKFSRQKADYLTTIPNTVLDEAPMYHFEAMREIDGQEVVKTLKKLRGVGEWTSQNVAMRGLPHLDVFIDEKATRAEIAPFYFRNEDEIDKKNFQEAVAQFAPYRSFACYYAYMRHFGSSSGDER